MDDECGYDLVLRDPEGGIIQRWELNTMGLPCTGTGAVLFDAALWRCIVDTACEDMAARREAV